MTKIVHKESYANRRKAEYPPLEDLADALYHERIKGNPEPMKEYLAKCDKVKKRYEKREDKK